MKQIRKIRRKGYSKSTNTLTPGGGIVVVPIPGEFLGTRLAIGIGGVADRITSNEDHYVSVISEAINQHIR